ncbi:bifunctional adenosylcobinamide kinase/adenosylcobinamide-phosphate guanylyltransferase [Domibacillus robiginosus]|uniref:bifunctional adenosylcobinamide kinase/adenosylcobinamide-phosphate guanylyltransferase n=1 Tax=Domibacillus robiginosus TaxID=1071054 RepID=UPI00067C32D2|nr:bifunctional adenosylcobinamide kinase/adenosylcobinamide-phosphate guanylyltransferase [Domibacillus robiginosus]
MIIFITGGVRSGKSGLAEELAMQQTYKDGRLVYIACGRRTDSEMDARIGHHQERRARSGATWITVEQSVDLGQIHTTASDILLIDCVTTLLAGEFFREDKPSCGADERVVRDLLALAGRVRAVILVSNELSFEPMSGSMTVQYAKKLGLIHQRLVQECEIAILVEHGIPVVKKGRISCVEL